MSRSWLKHLLGTTTVWIGRDVVSIVPGASGRAKKVIDTDSEMVLADDRATTPAGLASVSALQRLLERQSRSGMPPRLRIILSNEFVRYLLVPWTGENLSEAERTELVRALLIDRYGERESRFHIAVEPQRFEEASLAAAIDAEFVEALHACCRQMKLKISSLLPAIVANLNAQRSLLVRNKAGWYIDAGDGRLVALAFSSKGWATISSERMDESRSCAEILLQVLRRDSIRMPGLLNGTVYISTACGGMEAIPENWPVVRFNASVQQQCI